MVGSVYLIVVNYYLYDSFKYDEGVYNNKKT